jgi:glycine C-acetyltransferase
VLAKFVGCDSSLTFVSAWNANEGFTGTIAEEGDLVLSDALNHASIIDSMRLAKAISKCTTGVYKHSDMDDLRDKLIQGKSAKRRFIWTDGIFSMEGAIAKLPDILQLAREHDAIVAVDDSHATGVLGKTGRGTAEHHGVLGESTSSRRLWEKHSAARPADSSRVRRRLPTTSRSAHGRSCSRTRSHRPSR